MSATYLIANNVGKIRLIKADTDVEPASDAVFTDEELTYFYTTMSSINLAAAMALEAWAAKYTASPDSEKIGDYAYTMKAIENMNKLKKELEDKDASTPYFTWSELNLSGAETTVSEDIE